MEAVMESMLTRVRGPVNVDDQPVGCHALPTHEKKPRKIFTLRGLLFPAAAFCA